MGQLNSNDVPPNPFVHGWKGTVVVPPLPASPPPPRTVQTISPVQQAYRIVSQPLQPATAARRSSSEWPVGIILAVGLIVTLLILVFVATASARQKSQAQQNVATNQVSIQPRQYQSSTTQLLPAKQSPHLIQAEASSLVTSPEPTAPAPIQIATTSYETDSSPAQVAQTPVSNPDRVTVSAPSTREEPTPIFVRPPQRTLPLLPDPPSFR